MSLALRALLRASADRRPAITGAAGAAIASLLLSGCSTVEWVKTRFVEPKETAVATAPAPAAPASPRAALPPPAPVPAPVPPPPPPAQAAPVPPPVVAPAAPLAAPVPPPSALPAPAPAPVRVAPPAAVPAPSAVPATPRVAAAPPTPRAGAAAPLTGVVPPRADSDIPAGRYAVQVGVFMVPTSAEAVRSRTSTQLRAQQMAEADAVRVIKRDNRLHVVVGEYASAAEAESMATRLRSALRQDVVVFRR